MPYVPSKKTDGKSEDRELIDAQVEIDARRIAEEINGNMSLLSSYDKFFLDLGFALIGPTEQPVSLAEVIKGISKNYDYEGAFLGELNYAITRLIQRVPQIKVELGHWKDSSELRYWIYACTVEALIHASNVFSGVGAGISGVFEDIKDEYKIRVNRSYEIAQIVKSGDCFNAPFYSKPIEVVDEEGNHIGYQEVYLKRSEATLPIDVLDAQIIIHKKKK